jgi:hypothetical protein
MIKLPPFFKDLTDYFNIQYSYVPPPLLLLLCGSTVIERALAASHTAGFLILFRHSVGLLKCGQPVAKAPAYTGQQNTERRGQTSMS